MSRRSPPSHLVLGSGFLPDDFPDRLKHFKEETGLTWEGIAMCVDADPRQVQRWRDGTAPCGDALFSLFKLAARVPGGVQLLLGEDICPPATAAPT